MRAPGPPVRADPRPRPRPGAALLPLLLSLQGLTTSLEVSESPGSVQVARGQTATLPCSFSTSAALLNLNVIWLVIPLADANQPEQVILYQGGKTFDGAPQFNGRVGFAGTMPTTNASIFINDTRLSDTGTYQCLVNNLPDRGGRNIGVTGLTVLVPPSAPLCRVQGSQDVGSDIVLACSSEEGVPRPTYLWEKLDRGPGPPAIATQDPARGTVALRNISVGNSGLYQCVASNAIGTSSCLLDLQVLPPEPRSTGLMAAAVGSGAAVLLLGLALLAAAGLYWRSKHREERDHDREEEGPNEIREDDLPPKCFAPPKPRRPEASSSDNTTLTSDATFDSRRWNGTGGRRGRGPASPALPVNGARPAPKTLLVTAGPGPSPRPPARSGGGPRCHAATRAVPVVVPAQSRAGSLV
ncbi:immunoglobulin superfamily member 11 [Tachyglossus aculeatus]|uniref:immunoglobulin superfamily member 11 n=1 Tax=Tachyglossus aculeatus TaxID=9261 RepID=UPI0018F681F7|nr:immunoglobulin superfamily member 11 [Tachyglossus aculeatus]